MIDDDDNDYDDNDDDDNDDYDVDDCDVILMMMMMIVMMMLVMMIMIKIKMKSNENSILLLKECTSFCPYSNRGTSISNKEGSMRQSIQSNMDNNPGLSCDSNNNIAATAATATIEVVEQ